MNDFKSYLILVLTIFISFFLSAYFLKDIDIIYIKSNKKKIFILLSVISLICIVKFHFYKTSYDFYLSVLLSTYLLIVAITDILYFQIIDVATIFFGIIFIIFRLYFAEDIKIMSILISMSITIVILLLMYYVSAKSIGLGDIKMFAVISILIGVPNVFYIIIRAMILATIIGIFIIISKKGSIKTSIPFAPFLFLTTII